MHACCTDARVSCSFRDLPTWAIMDPEFVDDAKLMALTIACRGSLPDGPVDCACSSQLSTWCGRRLRALHSTADSWQEADHPVATPSQVAAHRDHVLRAVFGSCKLIRDSSWGFSFHDGKTKLAIEMLNAVAQMHTFCHMHAQMHAQMQEFHAVSEHHVLPPHTRSSDHQGM